MNRTFSIGLGDIASLFSNIETILEVHEQMLSQLEIIYCSWPSLQHIGELFIKIVSYLSRGSFLGRLSSEFVS